MLRSRAAKISAAAIGGLLGAAGTLLLVSLINGADGFVRCTATASCGWIVPLIAGALTATVAGVLLRGRPARDLRGQAPVSRSSCEACGAPVLCDWRICPECGEIRSQSC